MQHKRPDPNVMKAMDATSTAINALNHAISSMATATVGIETGANRLRAVSEHLGKGPEFETMRLGVQELSEQLDLCARQGRETTERAINIRDTIDDKTAGMY